MEPERFTLTDDHLTLLRAMWVGWQDTEYGAPEIDPKRPYGNSNVERDIHDLLAPGGAGWDEDHRLPYGVTPEGWQGLRERYARLHRETQAALQILLHHGSIRPGNYERERYSSQPWRYLDA